MRSGASWRAAAAAALLCSSGHPALAQSASDQPGDKSAFTLFDPTPDDELRSFCTDRPPKANLPCTVDAGHFQYEADIANWTHYDTAGVEANTVLYANPTLKWGLTNTIDVEANLDPIETVAVKSAQMRQNLAGIGDFYLRLKANLAGAEGGDFQLAVIPYVKFATARTGIGNGATEGGAIVPVSFALPADFTLLFDPEIDILRNASNAGRHANFQTLANISRPLCETVTAYVELWGEADNDPAGPTKQASLDLSLSWLVRSNLQFDLGVNTGLTPATPKVQPFIGISQRF